MDCRPEPDAFSENDLHPKLDVSTIAGTGDLSDIWIANCRDGEPKMRLVSYVIGLRPELKREVLPNLEVLQQSKV